VTNYLTFLLQSVQGLDLQGILNTFQLLKRWVLFASFNACIVVTVESRFRRDFSLGKASLFANPLELLTQFFSPIFLIFASHILINIASFGYGRHV